MKIEVAVVQCQEPGVKEKICGGEAGPTRFIGFSGAGFFGFFCLVYFFQIFVG